MPKTYIKNKTPAGKLYYAYLNGHISCRSFKTATQAQKYAAKLKARYNKLKLAEVKEKET